ncbi:hypothetical protein [Microbulbifer marinus]|uniref:hypothetical protein n=1 Tax=Microbulbifer marinus TaxID=658218 RepID=UPI00111537F7|nr:hypothetical protein [Microbulbifer marinus]
MNDPEDPPVDAPGHMAIKWTFSKIATFNRREYSPTEWFELAHQDCHGWDGRHCPKLLDITFQRT